MTALDELLNTAVTKLPLLRNQAGALSPFTTPQLPAVPTPSAPTPPPSGPTGLGAIAMPFNPPAPGYSPISPSATAAAAMPAPLPTASPFSLPNISMGGQSMGGSSNPMAAAMAPLMNGGQGGTGSPHLDVQNAVHNRQHQLANGSANIPAGGPTGNISYASLPGKYGPLVNPPTGPSDLMLQKGALQSLHSAGVPLSAILGGSYRTYAQQAASYASDSSRFAPPGQSLHEYGLAIDVNSSQIAKYQGALLNHGWYRERSDEPWHFSFGVYTTPPANSGYTGKNTQSRSAPQQQPHQAPTTGKSQQPPAKRVRVTGGKVPNLRGI